MNKKMLQIMLSLFMVLLVSVTSVGCGAEKGAYDAGLQEDSMAVGKENGTATDDVMLDVESTGSTGNVQENRKIIENMELSVETKEFSKLLAGVEEQISQMGGYIENSNIYGREIDSEENRSAELVVRIPAEKSKDFSGYIAENSVVVHRAVNTEDVTLEYVDMESRVAALRAEKDALEKLLKNAEKVEDIISVRSQLTEVIYEIESYESQLRTYDNLVSYATITIWIEEVERTTVVEKQNAWQQIGTNLKNNFSNMWDGVVAVFVFVISAIPYLIPFGVIAGIILLFIRLWDKKKQKDKK